MTQRVLLIGQDPDTVDFSDPALPPEMDADKIRAGLALSAKQFADLGVAMDTCMTDAGETAEAVVNAQLAGQSYDCVVIGGGLRLPASNLLLFEKVVNAVHRHAPGAAIAFNTSPPDTANAARRWLAR